MNGLLPSPIIDKPNEKDNKRASMTSRYEDSLSTSAERLTGRVKTKEVTSSRTFLVDKADIAPASKHSKLTSKNKSFSSPFLSSPNSSDTTDIDRDSSPKGVTTTRSWTETKSRRTRSSTIGATHQRHHSYATRLATHGHLASLSSSHPFFFPSSLLPPSYSSASSSRAPGPLVSSLSGPDADMDHSDYDGLTSDDNMDSVARYSNLDLDSCSNSASSSRPNAYQSNLQDYTHDRDHDGDAGPIMFGTGLGAADIVGPAPTISLTGSQRIGANSIGPTSLHIRRSFTSLRNRNGGPHSYGHGHSSSYQGLNTLYMTPGSSTSRSGFHSGSGSSRVAKSITTAPGGSCAGETETEADEPPSRLPTSRIVAPSPLTSSDSPLARLSPYLFEFCRLLAVVPAMLGVIWCIWNIIYLPSHKKPPERIDYLVTLLWALLTGHQSLSMTTGLLTRWSIYYPPLSTLIRLLALQLAICWPAVQVTLKVLNVDKRPVVTWAVIGSTTCVSRSIQIWVTSNLWWEGLSVPPPVNASSTGEEQDSIRSDDDESSPPPPPVLVDPQPPHHPHMNHKPGYWKRWRGGNWGGRRWDWKEVGVKCVLPAGVCYFVMAWAGEMRREMMA